MRFGPLSLNRRRTLRSVAGFVVAFLLAGQAMALTGCCAGLGPSRGDQATSALCPDHVDDSAPVADAKGSCPVDAPTAQPKSVDWPSAQSMPAIIDIAFGPVDRVVHDRPEAGASTAIPPPPLYARPHRLRL
jgi:hypothetical protein